MKLTDKTLREMAAIDGGGASAASCCSNQQEDDNVSIARTAMSEGGRSVRSIHSTRSLAAVAERSRENIAASCVAGDHGSVAAQASSGIRVEGPVNDIVVMTHQDDGGLRRGGKNTVSNLPYIRRNPAV